MKQLSYLFTALLILFALESCSSVGSDAKKAAKLQKESINHIRNKELQKAEESYQEVREIISRYNGTELQDEFYTAYNAYLISVN